MPAGPVTVKVISEVVRLKMGSEIVLFVFKMVNSSFDAGLSAAVSKGASEFISEKGEPLTVPASEKPDRSNPQTIRVAMPVFG